MVVTLRPSAQAECAAEASADASHAKLHDDELALVSRT